MSTRSWRVNVSGIETKVVVLNTIPRTGAGVILDNVCVYLPLCDFLLRLRRRGGGFGGRGEGME